MPVVSRRAVGLLLALLISVAAFVFLRLDKLFLITYLRLTAPSTVAESTEPDADREYLFDVTDGNLHENLAYDPKAMGLTESFFQLDSRHTLTLMHVTEAPASLESFGTFVEYNNGRFAYVAVQITGRLISYAEALNVVKTYAEILGVSNRFDISEYQAHLGIVEASETWVPIVRLPDVSLWFMLNCNWDRMSKEARKQLDAVACHPSLHLAPPDERADGSTQP